MKAKTKLHSILSKTDIIIQLPPSGVFNEHFNYALPKIIVMREVVDQHAGDHKVSRPLKLYHGPTASASYGTGRVI